MKFDMNSISKVLKLMEKLFEIEKKIEAEVSKEKDARRRKKIWKAIEKCKKKGSKNNLSELRKLLFDI